VLGQGVQLWTVPVDGTYQIDAYGAKGGSTPQGYQGGNGVHIRGQFTLVKNEIIRIVVGQSGGYGRHTQTSSSYNSCSGGGGTYVVRAPYDTNASILVIAGGGGGAAYDGHYSPQHGRNALTGTSGNSGAAGHAGGTNGQGGTSTYAGGGAGFFGDGANVGSIKAKAFTNSGSESSAYTSGLNHSVGGNGKTSWGSYPTYLAWGGFGGGGGGGGLCSGGGGGYSGGGTGSWTSNQAGGGGGSYNNGTSQYSTTRSQSYQTGTILATDPCNGKVIITKIT